MTQATSSKPKDFTEKHMSRVLCLCDESLPYPCYVQTGPKPFTHRKTLFRHQVRATQTAAPVSASVRRMNRKIWTRLLLMILVRLRVPAGGIGASTLMG